MKKPTFNIFKDRLYSKTKWLSAITVVSIISLTGCSTIGSHGQSNVLQNGTKNTLVNNTISPSQPAGHSQPSKNVNLTEPAQTPPIKNSYQKIAMFSNSVGWKISTQIGHKMSANSVFHTVNGGVNWEPVTLPKIVSQNLSLSGSLFVSGSDMWIIGVSKETYVMHTINGGKTWSVSTLSAPYLITYVSSLDAAHARLLVSAGSATGHEPVMLYKTSDGGKTWSVVHFQSSAGIPTEGIKTGMIFLDSQHGWVTIDNGLHLGNIVVYATHDGGSSWEQQPFDITNPKLRQAYAHPEPPIFYSSQSGILPVIFSNAGTVFYTTNNGGQTWTPTTMVPVQNIKNVAFMGNDIWVSDGTDIYGTLNKGVSWQKWVYTRKNQNPILYLRSSSNNSATVWLNNGATLQIMNDGQEIVLDKR